MTDIEAEVIDKMQFAIKTGRMGISFVEIAALQKRASSWYSKIGMVEDGYLDHPR